MDKNDELKNRIIGLGKRSFQKSYYPELRKKISELELFKSMIDQSSDLMLLVDKSSGNVVYRNLMAANFFSYNNDICQKTISDLIDKKFWDLSRKAFKRKRKDERVTFNYEKNILGKNTVLEINIDDIIYEDAVYALFVIHDISYRVHIDKEIRDSERNFKNVFNNSSESILIFNTKDLKFLNANAEFYKRMGYDHFEILQMTPLEVIASKDLNIVKERITKLANGEELGSFETEAITKYGKSIPVEINTTLINYFNQPAFLSMVRDISERKEYDQRLFETMIEVEEAERKRMAEDLHDEIGPLLSTLNMYISALPSIGSPEKKEEFYNKISGIVQETTTSVRQISNALSPHLLSNFGLDAAVKTIVDQTKDVIEIDYQTNIEEIRIHSNLEVIYYRIVKELINNTLKHAQANRINISLDLDRDFLKLLYKDDGKGFDFRKKMENKKTGIGLFNIISRVQKIGGKYYFRNNEPSGIIFELETRLIR